MSIVTLSTTKEQRGPCLLLDFTLNCFRGNNHTIKSKSLAIDKLGMAQFNFSYNSDDKMINIHFTSKQHVLARGNIKMNVVCTTLKFSDQRICSEDWGPWENMGKLSSTSSCNDALLFLLKLSITVNQVDSKLDVYDKFYKDTELVDFRLSTADGSGRIGVHKLILSASSDVFKTMISGDWKEKSECRIEIKDVTFSTLKYLKDYMYMGILPDIGLRPLLLIAQQFLMDGLKNDVIKKIADTVTAKNLYTVLELACEHNIPELALAVLCTTPNSVVDSVYQSQKTKRALETSW